MNTKGAGLTYINDYQTEDMKVFRAGLKNVPLHQGQNVKGTTKSVRAYHDKLNYERGFIQHSRSTANQYINFHYMYGGVRKYILERYFHQVWYKRNIRNWWAPILFSYVAGGVTMRMYDNAAYDYFYFID